MKHTRKEVYTIEGRASVFARWNGQDCPILQAPHARLAWHENIQKAHEEDWANLNRAAACWNAFHGTDLEPEQIPVGLIVDVRRALKNQAACCPECGGTGTYRCGQSYEPCEACNDIRALLAQLSPSEKAS